jgi:prolyl oligopeptidase
MAHRSRLLVIALSSVAALFASTAAADPPATTTPPLSYPPARRDATIDVIAGTRVADPYRWLEDATRPDVKAWLAAEDELTRDFIGKLPGRERLRARLQALMYVESTATPVHRGKRYFYLRRHADKEKRVLHWRDGEHGSEHTLIDPNALSASGAVSLGDFFPSWDGKHVAYVLHPNNSDAGVLHVIDVESGAVSSSDVIDGADYTQPSWTRSGDGFYYSSMPPASPTLAAADRFGHITVRFHALGSDPSRDAVVRAASNDPTKIVDGHLSDDGRWLFAYLAHGESVNDVWFRDPRRAGDDWHPLAVGQPHFYVPLGRGDAFYMLTNEDAPHSRIFRVDPRHPERASWREIVPERKGVVIDGLYLAGGHLVLSTLVDATSRLEVRTLDGKLVRDVPLPGLGTIEDVTAADADDAVFFTFKSPTLPPRVLATSVKTGAVDVWAASKVPFDATPFTVEQKWYPSKDGTRISMFIVRKKDQPMDGTTPYILYGYGGFTVATLPTFRPEVAAWLEAGGAMALTNLRGGGEYGEAWHQAGMLSRKQNVFDDFAAAASWLVTNKYTRGDKLAIYGRSNGGLLVSTTMTQHPELARAVLCGVPLTDMIRYSRFGGGKTWIPEYGDPERADDFKWLYAYSPYHHVQDGVRYPSLLMLTADADDRVEPLHARKFVAAVQHAEGGASKDGRVTLLRLEKQSGHAGADVMSQLVDYWADAYVFLLHELAMQ